METRITKTRVNGMCNVTISLVLSKTEEEKVKKFSPPVVDSGGVFSDQNNTFELPSKILKIPSNFPHVQKFDGVEIGHALAESRARTYENNIRARLTVSMNDFKSIEDKFDGEEVFTI